MLWLCWLEWGQEARCGWASGLHMWHLQIFLSLSHTATTIHIHNVGSHMLMQGLIFKICTYLQATRERINPRWVSIHAISTRHLCEMCLENLHRWRVDYIFWQPIVYIDHAKYRSKMQAMLKIYIQDMTVQLLVVFTGAE